MISSGDSAISYAELLLREDRSMEAIKVLRNAGVPDDPKSCALLARAYYQHGDSRGDLHCADFFANRALQSGFEEKWIYAIKALVAFRKERYADAVTAFERYIDAGESPHNQFIYGQALVHSGHPEKGLEWIETALKAEAENPLFREGKAQAEEAVVKHRARSRAAEQREWHLGGASDVRKEKPAPYAFNAMSRLKGHANQPKDFDWLQKNIPCQRGCPAGTDIPGYLSAIYRGDYDAAYRINLRDNVFPAVLGRVCSRPCEAECRHGWAGLGEPVAICFSKRSAADFKTQDIVDMEPWYGPSGKKVAVVGSGPAGLAAARNLALLGHQVTVYEKHNKPGGMMNQGIPKFRLPWEYIDKEIEQVRRCGVEIVCDTEVGPDIPLTKLVDDNDAVVMAAGTLRPNVLDLPGKDLDGIRHGLDFLLEANENDHALVGKHIIVIGGGFTAMDCARASKRLGAKLFHIGDKDKDGAFSVLDSDPEQVRVWYRRTVREMLVTPGELEELEHESIPMEFMVSPKAYVGEGGKVTGMRFMKTQLGQPDASGRRRPIEEQGSEFEVPADTVLLATGQFPDTAWIDEEFKDLLVEEDEWLKSGKSQVTAHPKIFVAGDFATGAQSLIDAIGHAKDAARDVDKFLMGQERLVDVAVIEDVSRNSRMREMDWVPLQKMPAIDLGERDLTAEVETGYDPRLAVDETQRCYFCHFKYEIDSDKCIYCDWCIKAKPRPNCIVKVKQLIYDDEGKVVDWDVAESSEETNLIWINQEDCIRCNACVEACPVDCISIQKVSLDILPKAEARLEP